MAALRVEGVTAVANDLSVHMPYRSTRSDRQITAAIRDAIGWNVIVPPGCVKVSVSAHVVTLSESTINSRCLTAPCPKMPPRGFRRPLNAVRAVGLHDIPIPRVSPPISQGEFAIVDRSSRRTAS